MDDVVGDGRVALLPSVLLDVIDCNGTAVSSLVELDVDDDIAVEVEFEVNCFVCCNIRSRLDCSLKGHITCANMDDDDDRRVDPCCP